MPILHESQLASLLGLPATDATDPARTAGDTLTLLTSWCGLIEPVSWELLIAPTRSRRRTTRNLTVNVFHPFELLPEAWDNGLFAWNPDLDDEREAQLASADAVHQYATRVSDHWAAFLTNVSGSIGRDNPIVDSPRGEISFSNLLEQQRWHAAFHHRQIVDFLGSNGIATDSLDVSGFVGLDLPTELY